MTTHPGTAAHDMPHGDEAVGHVVPLPIYFAVFVTLLFVGIAFFWLGTMIVLTMSDVVSRGWFGAAGLG